MALWNGLSASTTRLVVNAAASYCAGAETPIAPLFTTDLIDAGILRHDRAEGFSQRNLLRITSANGSVA